MLFSLLSTALGAALTISSSAFAAPLASRDAITPLNVTSIDGPVVPGQYIVKLKDSANTASHIASLPFVFSPGSSSSPVKYLYSETVFKGYAGSFSGSDLAAILASPDVELVQPNAILNTTNDQTQQNAPWNLQSISTQTAVGGSDTSDLDYTYYYTAPAGDNVDIYIIDTGINTSHEEFEGRASFGWAAPSYQMVDGNGHGTHCAGIAAAKTYGVAKNAYVIAVKVMSDNGTGTTDDIIAGLDWVVQNAQSTGKPSVGSMSLGGSPNQALDTAVNNTIAAGIPIAVAAGNSSEDADMDSPARVPAAITVAASDIDNNHAYFSNWGPAIDIYAPGVDVTSTWIGSNTATAVLSGTSMSTPHIAGLCAYILSINDAMTPADVQTTIKNMGTADIIGAPPTTTNSLAYNGGSNGIFGSNSGSSNAVNDAISGAVSAAENVSNNAVDEVSDAVNNVANLAARSNLVARQGFPIPSPIPNGDFAILIPSEAAVATTTAVANLVPRQRFPIPIPSGSFPIPKPSGDSLVPIPSGDLSVPIPSER